MPSRRALVPLRARDVNRSCGSLRFLIDLSASAVPNHPGESDRCKCSLLRESVTGFALSGGLAALKLCHEAESGSRLRITADAFADAGFDEGVTPNRRCARYTVNEQLPWLVPFN